MKADTLNIFDNGETRTPILVVNAIGSDGGGITFTLTATNLSKQIQNNSNLILSGSGKAVQGGAKAR